MRRPLIGIFIIAIFVAFIYTRNIKVDSSYDNDKVILSGIVKSKINKQKYDEYKVDKFLVRDYSKSKKLKVGEIIKLNGKFKNLDNMRYEDFNYGRYLKSVGYKGIIYIDKYYILGENLIYTYLGKMKTYIRDTFRYLYKENSNFINSIILGEKENLTEEEKDIFNKTGTSHIIAISGLHTGILCTMIVFMVRGINNIYKLFILAIIMTLYCGMVGFLPSIIRAIVFLIILYIAIFIDRKRDSISTLSLVGIFLVINNPYIIYNISFQLSFLATLSIIYFYGYINYIIKIKVISLTLSANVLTLPIIYYNFKGISIISIIGNLIIVPFMGLIIYLSIISVILFRINIWMAKVIAYFNKITINFIYILLEKCARLDFAYINIENPSIYYVTIYYVVVFSYMVYKELKVMKEQENGLQGYYKEYEG